MQKYKSCWELCSYRAGSSWGNWEIAFRIQTKKLYRLSLQWCGIALCAWSIQTKFIEFHLTECHFFLSSGCLFAFLPFPLLHYKASCCSRLINWTYQPVLSLGMRRLNPGVSRSTLGRQRTKAHFWSSLLCCLSTHRSIKRFPRNRPWKPIELWDVKDPTLSRQSTHS
jgi:hypothetical protein